MTVGKNGRERDLASFGELELIERIRKRLLARQSRGAGKALVVEGIGDDAAVLRSGKGDNLLILTCDTLVEDVHFHKGTPPERIGWKAMACNLSDIAAMGGIPRHALVSLACPAGTKVSEIDAIYAGMTGVADRFGVTIVGGDTVESPGGLVVTVTLSGEVEKDRYVTRGGARPGDVLCVTGTLGGSLLGKHLTFLPRVAEGRFLAEKSSPTAMIDISDGLGSDLMKMMRASGTTAEIFAEEIPVSEAAIGVAKRKRLSPVEMALYDGEDFELLFTLAEEKVDGCLGLFRESFSTPVTIIGGVKRGRRKPVLVNKDGTIVSIEERGYEHFRRKSIGQRLPMKNEGVRNVRPDDALVSGRWVTRSPSETVDLGKALGKRLSRGDVVALFGELGSGKTTLIKGLAAGLGAKRSEEVRSPTFVLLNLYRGRVPIYHVDLYRVQSLERLHDIGYEEYAFGDGVMVMEWAEKADEVLPEKAVRIRLKTLGKRSREIRVEFPGENDKISP